MRLIAAASDDGDEEKLVVLEGGEGGPGTEVARLGRINELVPDPAHDRIAVVNHRHELHLLDLETGRSELVEANPHGPPEDPAWSHDGLWLAYASPLNAQTTAIKLYRPETGRSAQASEPVLKDSMPAFDPLGRYLYFIGQRAFSPSTTSSSSTWVSRWAPARTR
ncbi:hypothetical protein ACFQ0B_39745 [Nonomuraea thailandensis]